MATMVRPDIESFVDERIVEALDAIGAVTTAELIDYVWEHFQLDSPSVRRAIWRLISSHRIEMLPDQKLSLSQRERAAG